MINLYYVRAAIEANTGHRLSLPRVRELLLEEGLITQKQADEEAKIFTGYDEFFDRDSADTREEPLDVEEGLPDGW